MRKINLRRIIFIAVLVAAVLILSQRFNFFEGLDFPSYTTFSTREEGAALIYDTLSIMGYPVRRDTMFISAGRPTNNVQIVIAPMIFDDELREKMIDWVIHGGQLLFFDTVTGANAGRRLLSGVTIDGVTPVQGGVLYRIGLGTLFVGDASRITNISLLENDGEYGQLIVNLLNTMDFVRIYFNEAYHGYNQNRTFFEILPLPLRLMGVQIGLIALVVVLYSGRRFGKVAAYYEEVEREENEYVFTLSNLYMSIGLGGAVLNVYDKKFKKLAYDYFGMIGEPDYYEIYELWKSENKGSLGKLEYIIENQETEFNTKRKKERAEFLKTVACYRDLIKELKK
ncbi:MAG: hypothetical protein FWE24_02995 [Defluviitaleaceae bacterium]|nr:hypothetical protein [Defluviitaleaceae bacterium]